MRGWAYDDLKWLLERVPAEILILGLPHMTRAGSR